MRYWYGLLGLILLLSSCQPEYQAEAEIVLGDGSEDATESVINDPLLDIDRWVDNEKTVPAKRLKSE